MMIEQPITEVNLTPKPAEKDQVINEKDKLVDGLKAGDRNIFRIIFDKYYEPLSRFCMRFTDDQADAEEIVQDVFVTLWEKRNQININTSLNAYLYQSVRNKALNFKSHLDVRQAHADHVKSTPLHLTDYDELAGQELQAMYDTALEAMPHKRRQIFEMSRNEGLKYAEIAAKLEISVKTVEAHLSKALEDFREKLSDFLPIFIVLLNFFLIS
jgi:RNA polymerase sigma-70 factor (ECF subfamily)